MKRFVALLGFVFALTAYAGAVDSPPPPPPAPNAAAILEMAKAVTFATGAVTDDPVPAEIKNLNLAFGIEVYYRAQERDGPVKFVPDTGAVFALVKLRGIPEEYKLPDGSYYLWIVGHMSNLAAYLVSTDGKVVTAVEVRDQPSLPEEAVPHHAKVHAGALLPGIPGPGPIIPPNRPPPPRSWREICVHPAPLNRATPGKRWIRVPDL